MRQRGAGVTVFEPAVGKPSDRLIELLSQVARQERPAFSELYKATSPKVYGVVARILGRGARAEEVMQDVYVKVWRRASDFDGSRASPITWMATIARNCAIDEARRAALPIVDLPDADLLIPTDEIEPLASRERSEGLRALLRCLSGLDPEKRDLILLAYYRGMSREALAARFDRPVATVKTWLHRGLAQLKLCLAQ
jgi:RNA polymerase sigma-70 factor (ECF subfamily)